MPFVNKMYQKRHKQIQAGMGASGEMILHKACWITKPTLRVDREVGPRAAERMC